MLIGRLSAVLLLSFALVGCNEKSIRLVDGRVPEAFLPAAEKFVGRYSGEFKGERFEMEVRLDGDLAVISSAQDFTSYRCDSKVGKLSTIYFKKKKKTGIRIADFAFELDPNLCSNTIEGRHILVSAKLAKDNTVQGLELSIFKEMDPNGGIRCTPSSLPEGGGCFPVDAPVYIRSGLLQKQE